MFRRIIPQATTLRRSVSHRPRTCARPFRSSGRVNEESKSNKDPDTGKRKSEPTPLSSCPENTIIVGVNYLKGQEPILAKKDEDYPAWLWSLLKPKEIPDDGPGGLGEKMRLRAANKKRIKEQNFLKTQ
ncbi:uncharacterized protein FOMMEDRAFT_166116 [Fomitiporia mediterranea MF3/22]|uniref:uncharacterized protein n=1 Tax=Fomitiporia mediterranea (strain MF3/22) TaxID=694068 RepID=UPI0004408BAA|nr:uncharacterized protein FOMMEDRAFT_166116 [Fomitiporia mediterranea MF3/22]EJD05773.1 hypothetical protein FOMMEDRAFT_166116 [Fomitiporia mediterranea MF3/22]